VDELSLNPGSIPKVKAIIRTLNIQTTTALTEKIVQTSGAAEARQMAQDFVAALS
jgi:phosphoenolpyruvate-protein kinase (PTS system EI component)